MSRWIDADALAYIVASNGDADFINKVTRLMIDAPSIDIVRCKECRYWEMRNSPRGWCVVHQGYVLPQYFCADGEREGE